MNQPKVDRTTALLAQLLGPGILHAALKRRCSPIYSSCMPSLWLRRQCSWRHERDDAALSARAACHLFGCAGPGILPADGAGFTVSFGSGVVVAPLGSAEDASERAPVLTPTTWTIIERDGPNHLVLWCNAHP